MSGKDKPFIMRNTQACATALRHWLKNQSPFNSFSLSPMNDRTTISLVWNSDPEGDWGKVKSRSGRTICRDDDDGEVSKLAEGVIRRHLKWPAKEGMTERAIAG